ncbi:hypothetical protein D1AOALGA4SA_2352 [Olavius algarvensis Delta 1 endosymbiont]|nr:hypothetical protein D1AOALGA4SA_2352 [Olavius algarvensis Delta 1 endosymbiont]
MLDEKAEKNLVGISFNIVSYERRIRFIFFTTALLQFSGYNEPPPSVKTWQIAVYQQP